MSGDNKEKGQSWGGKNRYIRFAKKKKGGLWKIHSKTDTHFREKRGKGDVEPFRKKGNKEHRGKRFMQTGKGNEQSNTTIEGEPRIVQGAVALKKKTMPMDQNPNGKRAKGSQTK